MDNNNKSLPYVEIQEKRVEGLVNFLEEKSKEKMSPLTLLVHITQPRTGMMYLVWPPIFRGIEQPNEEHPSLALEKLKQKFLKEHPRPFSELKELAHIISRSEHGDSGIMDFLEAPLDKEEYITWNARHYGVSQYDGFIGGWGNLGEKISNKECDDLRRNEYIGIVPMAGYHPKNTFDMEKHNNTAFLSIYESLVSEFKGETVLLAYGRLIALTHKIFYRKFNEDKEKEEEEHIENIIKKLKFYPGEYLKTKIDPKIYAKLVE